MFSWSFPYPSQRMPVMAKNVIATSQPLAAQAGLAMLAKGGNAVDAGLAAAITLTVVEPTFKGFSEFCWTFLPKDRAPYAGERFYCPQQAETLEDIASTKGESFYRGPIAERIALASRADEGAMTEEDLAAHRADWIDPIAVEYRGYHLHQMPPNCQGIAALIALGILRNFDVAGLAVDSADSLHLQ